MKKFIIIVAIIILAGLGVYFMRSSESVPETMNEAPASQEETSAPTGAQGKININEVCEGALIRMTFPDGASAEKFVADCKEGKHPEVIEQFKAEMNLGAGAEI